MSAYGVHPTQYGTLSDSQLHAMFRESVYSRLTENEKQNLLQETVNRDALERGMVGAPLVQFSDLPSNESGNAANGVINVNYDMAVKGIQTVEYKGQLVQRAVSDYNIQTLNTVLHESVHCFQDQVIDGTITIDDWQLTNEYRANAFTVSPVLQNSRYQLGSQYLTGETQKGYYMYYFQATERDAYLDAEKKTADIIQDITLKHGTEDSFAAYQKNVETLGYHAKEQEAIQLFQNPDFVKDLNQTLHNQYFGTNLPVNPNTANAVKAEMIATYGSMQQSVPLQNIAVNKEDARENQSVQMQTGTVGNNNGGIDNGGVENEGIDNNEDLDDGLDI